MQAHAPIGIFDSGYGGLTVMQEIVKTLPAYDYVYLGDNARTPYGSRSFKTVYQYTWQCVQWLFGQGCPLVILACNTASAKALRSIQQNELHAFPGKKVLGVIRPTTEVLGTYSASKHVGILGTSGTVASNSYSIEIEKFFPNIKTYQQACPLWVPLIEHGEFDNPGAAYFIEKYVQQLIQQSDKIDTVLLACTHYPLIKDLISKHLPSGCHILSQGEIVASSLKDYLERHPEIESICSTNGIRQFFTTDQSEDFDRQASSFYGERVTSEHVDLK